jgi:tetratricopeptide (TPR) repeat protein
LEKQRDHQTGTESKTRIIEQINTCLGSGDYSRALDLLRGAAAEFPNDNDAQLSDLEKLAHDGVKRNAEANRLITESQELFAHRKSPEAIQLLRQAYQLDKNNSLARAILANALVEHARVAIKFGTARLFRPHRRCVDVSAFPLEVPNPSLARAASSQSFH